ncbi:MAG: PilZ domain-containing protein [Candidatus Hydrogenedentota bacterium]
MTDLGAGANTPPERKGKADRQHHREYVVLRAIACFDNGPPTSCGLMDISAGGCRLKNEYDRPREGASTVIAVDAIQFRGIGTVVRTFDTPTGVEVAVKFDQLQPQIPAKMLQYKLKSFQGGGIRRR